MHARDGYDYDGYRLRVEFPRGSQNSGGGHRSVAAYIIIFMNSCNTIFICVEINNP